MLQTNTLDAVAPYVEHSGTTALTPIPGSSLSNLTSAIIERCKFTVSTNSNHFLNNDFKIDDAINLVNECTNDTEEHMASHERITNEAVKHLTRIMRNNIFLARSTVLPLIDKYAEQLDQEIAQRCNSSSLALTIIEDKRRSILASPQLKAAVSRQANRTVFDGIELPRLHKAAMTAPELTALIATGNRGFDETISNWIKINNLEEQLKNTYNDVFGYAASSKGNLEQYINPRDYHATLIALLICWGLVRNIQDDLNIDLNDYRKRMEGFAGVCANYVSQAISKYERGMKYKNLVLEYPNSGRQFVYDDLTKNAIIVDPVIYESFLAQGGRPEMIMGAYLTDRTVNAQGILTDAAKYGKAYQKVVAQGRLTAINNTLTIVKKSLRLSATQIVKDILEQNDNPDEYSNYSQSVTFTGNTHMVKANQFIDSIGAKDIENIYSLVRRFICTCFFDGSMVYDLLNRIDALNANDCKDINELALVATTDLIVDWFIDQIEVDTRDVSLEGYYTN